MKRRRDSRLTVLSAFTGAGGLDVGLEHAGFRTIACIENNAQARRTIQLNRSNWNLFEAGDIAAVTKGLAPSNLGLRKRQLSILAGGPPCQPFSKAAQWARGRRAGLADPRAKCLAAFLSLADRFLPRVILIENVPGFARGKTSAIPYIKAVLRRINREHGTRYRLESRILNAADYGVPQRRERAILIARRDGKAVAWPSPSHKGRPVRVYDALHAVRSGPTPKAKGQWAGLLPAIPEGMNYLYHTEAGGGLPLFGARRRYWSFLLKLAKDKPAWTIPAQPGPATGPFHWRNRPLSVPELLRLQTFPTTWRVAGNRNAQVRQIGNATPPLLAEVVGRAIGASMFQRQYDKRVRLGISRRRSIPRPSVTTPVPRKYHKLKGKQTAHPGEGKGPGALPKTGRRLATTTPERRVGRALRKRLVRSAVQLLRRSSKRPIPKRGSLASRAA